MKKSTDITRNEVSLPRKLAYAVSGIGSEFVYTTISLYLMFFFTDIALIGPAIGGMILMVSRGWDAFADFFMGFICDHVKKKNLLVIGGAIPLGIAFCMLWQVPDLSITGKEIYFFVFSWLAWTLLTITQMPLTSMVPNMTMDTHERTRIMALCKTFGLITLILIGGAFMPLVNLFSEGGSRVPGFSKLGIIIGILVALSFFVAGLITREKHTVSADHRYKFKEGFMLIIRNKPYMVLVAAVTIEFTVFTMVGMVMNYFFKYCIPFESFVPIAFSCTFAIAAVSMPLWVYLSKRIGKKLVYQIGFLGYGGCLFYNFFMYEPSMPLLIPAFVLAGIFFGGLSLSFMSNTPDTVDFGQWNTGQRCEGFQFGVYSFMIKFSGSLSGVVVGFILEFSGYKPNVVQSEGSLFAIRMLMTVVPFILCVCGALVMQMYKLDADLHKKICEELEAKHSIS